MNTNIQELSIFNKACDELISGKYILIDVKINYILSAINNDPKIKDIGILASCDPVALDKACIDLVYNSNDPGKAHFIERVESRNGTLTIKASEQLNIGSCDYELIEVK